jgi:hypothetical protein
MKCPKCNVEGIIKNSHIVKNDRGEEFKRVVYFCKNKNCSFFNKEIGDKTRRIIAD